MEASTADRGLSHLQKRGYSINLSTHIKTEIIQHARGEAPKECCGFIMSDGSVYRANNASANKNKFKIAAQDYALAARDSNIEAVYHSHPSTEPRFSEFDKFNSISHNFVYVLYSMRDNSFTQFDPSLAEFNKYIGRKFEIGKTDCYSLIKDFYKFELDIQLNEYHRDQAFHSYLGDLFDKHFEREGFLKVDELQKYDCILLRKNEREPSNHIVLYLDNNLILHQPGKSYSRMEEYTSTHRKLTNYIIRHKQWTTA